jgi:hypothetical protein
VAQRLVISHVYELPIGRGKPFLNNFGPVANWLSSGWQVNGITTFQSGIPLVITSGQNNAGIFSPGQRPNVAGQSARITGGTRADRIAKWFDTSLFTFAPAFTFGNAPRTQPDARNPGTRLFDISIFKNSFFREGKYNAQFRAEFFNAFNTTQLGGPGTTLSGGNFGVISSASGPRQIQLALKLIMRSRILIVSFCVLSICADVQKHCNPLLSLRL